MVIRVAVVAFIFGSSQLLEGSLKFIFKFHIKFDIKLLKNTKGHPAMCYQHTNIQICILITHLRMAFSNFLQFHIKLGEW